MTPTPLMPRLTPLVLAAAASVATAGSQSGWEQRLLPHDGAAGDLFGLSVSLDGVRALVGAAHDDVNGTDSGSAYLFGVPGGAELRRLTPSDGAFADFFGTSVSLDGDLALVGSSSDDDGGTDSGSAYLFDAATGQQLWKLTAADAATGDHFGQSVSLDGGMALVGAHRDDDSGSDSGSAYLFDATTGQQLGKFTASDGAASERFGISVSISGGLALVGAYRDDVNGTASGSAYVFDVTTGQELAKLVPADGAAHDWFGWGVSLDGGLALVGAVYDDDNGTDSGSAYLFDAVSGQQLRKLTPSDGAAADAFGGEVSLSGGRALVGASSDDDHGGESGSAYLFDALGGQQLGKFTASDGSTLDFFGHAVSLDGGLALVGAMWDDDNGTNSGSAYLVGAVEVGAPFCLGDPGVDTPCPCNNDNDGSTPGSGCANGVFPSGARLRASGVPSLGEDTLVLTATGLEPGNTGLFFQAQTDLSPGVVWGDGLRCAGPDLVRLEVRFADAAGTSSTTTSVSTHAGNISPGDTKRYQCWYRSSVSSPCGPGVHGYNASNGLAITWRP